MGYVIRVASVSASDHRPTPPVFLSCTVQLLASYYLPTFTFPLFPSPISPRCLSSPRFPSCSFPVSPTVANQIFLVGPAEVFAFAREPWTGRADEEVMALIRNRETLPQPDTCPDQVFEVRHTRIHELHQHDTPENANRTKQEWLNHAYARTSSLLIFPLSLVFLLFISSPCWLLPFPATSRCAFPGDYLLLGPHPGPPPRSQARSIHPAKHR